MRYAIVSDIHSNLVAFKAVLRHIETTGPVEELWCLGDTVGYGPAPNECLELLRGCRHVCIAGNHDWAALGKLDVSQFNPDAAAAALWTKRNLNPENRDYLDSLPLSLVREGFSMAHGSPRNPIWEYVLSELVAAACFDYFEGPLCMVGHSHFPLRFDRGPKGRVKFSLLPPDPFHLKPGRSILNPGSVGQPRDGDPRASYVIYDAEAGSFQHHRVPYDIASTQAEMRRFRLPRFLADRLSRGQ